MCVEVIVCNVSVVFLRHSVCGLTTLRCYTILSLIMVDDVIAYLVT